MKQGEVMKYSVNTAITLASAFLMVSAAQAGTRISTHIQGQEQAQQLYVHEGKAASLDSSGRTEFIYDDKAGEMITLMHEEGRYMRLNDEQMQQMAGGISKMQDQAMKQMEEQMANLPPEQRVQMQKMMEEMMPGMANKKPSEKVSLESSGKSDSINGTDCEWIALKRGDKLISEACVADLDDTAIESADYQTLAGFFKKMSDFTSQMSGDVEDAMLNQHLFANNKVPVQIKEHKDTGIQVISLTFDSQQPKEDMFTIPKGYKQESMPEF
ncbi:hypothetical protein AT746_11580 [Lacimicrobium alkaliphilum]|uniref:DUF4412 domain-containing protein n=2 Tax=Lacimicrobium alkaliphilum TaxID=1526571 RepID=A0A0U3B1A5_9ALTE|nr:hypothetical protein AT746_11580 [Lacimicrobium alkaliphilum]